MQNIPRKIVPLYSKIPDKIMTKEIKESRSLKLFENAIKSHYTRKGYRCTLKKFMAFTGIDDFDNLACLQEKEIQTMLEDYVIRLKIRNLNPNSFPIMFTSLQLFFSMNDKNPNGSDVPFTVFAGGQEVDFTEIKKHLLKELYQFHLRTPNI
jgi:hypothetical protein